METATPSPSPASTSGSSGGGGAPPSTHSSTGNSGGSPANATVGSKLTGQAPPTGQSTGQVPAATPSPSSEMFDVKVNGKMIKMSRQEVIDHASMTAAAQQKFEEAAKMRREFDQNKELAKKDFFKLLQDPSLGLSKDQIRERFEQWYHQEFIEPESLTHEQRELRQTKAELTALREAEQTRQSQADQEQTEKLTAQQREYLQNEIIEAFEASGLPKSKLLMSRMAFYMRQNLSNGWDAPKEMLIKQVKNERQAMMSDLIQGSNVEQLTELFGEEIMNKIRKYDLEQLRQRRQVPAYQNNEVPIANNRSQGKVYGSDVTQRLRDIRTGKISF